MKLSSEDILKINRGYFDANQELIQTILEMKSFCARLESENKNAFEYGFYGTLRRLFLIKKCLDNFQSITPPCRNKELDDEKRKDLNLFLHSFLLHISGSIDNLAWVWFYCKKIDQTKDPEKFRLKINLFHKQFKKYLDQPIIDKCTEFKEWYSLLKDFRNPAAHRIPPYIVPYTVDPSDEKKHNKFEKILYSVVDKNEQFNIQKQLDELRDYEPTYMHSFNEGSKMVRFHPQAIADTRSLCVLINLVIKHL